MSKYVKQLVSDQIAKRLQGVQYAMLVSFVGLSANANHTVRTALAAQSIEMMAIKNSMARRACEGTPLRPLFDNLEGSLALCWGAQDIVSLAKALVKLSKDKRFPKFVIEAAVVDSEKLEAAAAIDISKWPTREEQISILMGQISGVGAKLSSQFLFAGGALASQIKQLADKESVVEDAIEEAIDVLAVD